MKQDISHNTVILLHHHKHRNMIDYQHKSVLSSLMVLFYSFLFSVLMLDWDMEEMSRPIFSTEDNKDSSTVYILFITITYIYMISLHTETHTQVLAKHEDINYECNLHLTCIIPPSVSAIVLSWHK